MDKKDRFNIGAWTRLATQTRTNRSEHLSELRGFTLILITAWLMGWGDTLSREITNKMHLLTSCWHPLSYPVSLIVNWGYSLFEDIGGIINCLFIYRFAYQYKWFYSIINMLLTTIIWQRKVLKRCFQKYLTKNATKNVGGFYRRCYTYSRILQSLQCRPNIVLERCFKKGSHLYVCMSLD